MHECTAINCQVGPNSFIHILTEFGFNRRKANQTGHTSTTRRPQCAHDLLKTAGSSYPRFFSHQKTEEASIRLDTFLSLEGHALYDTSLRGVWKQSLRTAVNTGYFPITGKATNCMECFSTLMSNEKKFHREELGLLHHKKVPV